MKTEEEIRKALGRKSRQLKTENMIKVFLTITKEPSSFSELLKKTGLSKPVLSDHLKFLEKSGVQAIYRDTIKASQTQNLQEIGKVVYRATVDEIPRMLDQVLSLNLLSLIEPLEDEELDGELLKHKQALDRELLKHKQAIVKALSDYINQFNINRDRALKMEQDWLKKEHTKTPRKKES